jgi:hypothetical protein
MKRLFSVLLWLLVLVFTGYAQSVDALRVDKYGGLFKIGPGTGYFRTAKLGNRWFLVTPEGNAFFMIGLYGTGMLNSTTDDLGGTHQQRVTKKYGNADITFCPQANRRLLSWNFNALEIASCHWSFPGEIYPSWPRGEQPVKIPFVGIIGPSLYTSFNANHWAPGPTKDLYHGMPKSYDGWKGGSFPDVFDPNFDLWLDGAMRNDPYIKLILSPKSLPWLIGITCDDTDYLYGYGPGPDTPGIEDVVAPHLGWVSLVTNYEQTANREVREPQVYSDRKVYTKYALRDWLRGKYGEITALNAVWGANYSTWDSAGGWGRGSGFLDEDGSHRWVGRDYEKLSSASPRVRADLDEWLYHLATRHLSVCRTRIKQYAPHTLFMGPTVMNTWYGVTRPQLLRAYGEQADLVSIGWRDNQHYLDLTVAAVGDKPLITWNGVPANHDSALWRKKDFHKNDPQTQEERGRLYQYWIMRQFTATVSATGVHPFVGFRWWCMVDSVLEGNWGLTSLFDNAYDGKEARVARGTDSWGYPTGGEEKDYGNFVGPVTAANRTVQIGLRNAAAAAVPPKKGVAKSSEPAHDSVP